MAGYRVIGDRDDLVCINNVKFEGGVVVGPFTNLYNSTIGEETKVGAYTEIGGVTVGKRCKIQANVFIPPGVTIGDEVFIGPGVIFTNDKYPRATGTWHVLQTVVGNNSSIGAGAIILPGVKIGPNVMIGAGAVVSHDVEGGSVVMGVPARPDPREFR